jgi:hypothetical protein
LQGSENDRVVTIVFKMADKENIVYVRPDSLLKIVNIETIITSYALGV